MADIESINTCRDDFPALKETMHGKPLVYLDTASSAQKPQAVIDAMRDVMSYHYANIHRGIYQFSQVTTAEYEAVRGKVAAFLNAPSEREIVFTRNTTEAINLVAQCWARHNLSSGDEIILSVMEHHANIVPWQLIQDATGFLIKVIPLLSDGTLDLDAYRSLLSERTKLVALVQVSNTLGTINPVKEMIAEAKAFNPEIITLIDASQSVVHGAVDVQDIAGDFLAFTGHKLYGPTGAGVLWGRAELLDQMPPYQGGGDMVDVVTFNGTSFKTAPARFEAGTPAFVEVIGLGAAIDYLDVVGRRNIAAHERELLAYAMQKLENIDGLKFHGTAPHKAGIISFTADWGQNADIAMVLDQQGIAVRTGHHCCMPLMDALGVAGTIRASLGLYSNRNDIDSLVQGLKKAKDLLS